MRFVKASRRTAGAAGALGVALAVSTALSTPAFAAPALSGSGGTAGAVFSLSNEPSGNRVVSWTRSSKGVLAPGPTYETGGLGTGSGLGSQGAITISPDHDFLLAVSPGSDEVSAFSISGTSLDLLGTVDSRGDLPISVTVSDDVVYALNGGGVPNISGYTLDDNGLKPIPGSVRNLPNGAAGPAQVLFTPSGDQLVVTEKATNRIDTFAVGNDGIARAGVAYPSAGVTPFGFDFNNKGTLLVSDAVGGAPGASTASSYRVGRDGSVSVISGAVANGQGAACWLVATNNGKYAYTSNTGSGTLSSYAVGNSGSLTLVQGVAAAPGGSTIDAAFDRSSKHLFALDATNDKIDGFHVQAGGSLDPGSTVSGLPASAVGLAAL